MKINGGYEGFRAEGSPKTDWQATVAYTYDAERAWRRKSSRSPSFTKTYEQKPYGALRDDINSSTPHARPKRPIENVPRTGDLCAHRPAPRSSATRSTCARSTRSPNLAIVLPTA